MTPNGHKTPEPIRPTGFKPLGTAHTARPARAHLRHKVLIGGGGVLMLCALLFLLTARAVQIDAIAQARASVSVKGLAVPLGSRYLLLPGTYEVTATAPGYLALSTTVEVSKASSQRVELVLQPLPGKLTVRSSPAGAKLFIGGDFVGETPVLEASLPAGVHELELRDPRHLPLRQSVEVTGRAVLQELELSLLPAWASVSIASKPDGAEILVDGEPAGASPQQLELLQGERQLMLRLAGYADWLETLDIAAGVSRDLGVIELQPAPGQLQLNTEPTGANVTLNGDFLGQTPLLIDMAPNTQHTLGILKPGYQPYTEALQLAASSMRQKTVTLMPRLGSVRVRVNNPAAEVLVNGKPVGKGSRVLSLPAVEQRIEIRLAGYASIVRRITPRPGLEQLVEAELKTNAEARLARIKPQVSTGVGQTLLLFNPSATGSGQFTMGASRRDPGRRSNEVLRPVALQRMFYLQEKEVTNAQFRRFQADHKSGQVQGKSLNRETQPVVNISWQQAASFCNWLSRLDGLPPFYTEDRGIITGFDPASIGYRLPSEAEWAWVARVKGDALLRFAWGDSFPPRETTGNYADSDSAFINGRVLNDYKDGHVVSAPVGAYPPNHNGVYDLDGNVSEWVHDIYSIPVSNNATITDPLGERSGDNYVVRGASWSHARLPNLRLSYRDYGQAGRDDVGFRIARYAE